MKNSENAKMAGIKTRRSLAYLDRQTGGDFQEYLPVLAFPLEYWYVLIAIFLQAESAQIQVIEGRHFLV